MRPVAFEEVVPLERYASVRAAYREAVIAHKRDRRLPLGEKATLVFEDRETLRFQIQEMLWIERIADERKVQDEIDVYNELVPGENELSATLFIEITDAPSIRDELDRLVGLDEHVSLLLGEGADARRTPAEFDPKQAEEDRISAVQYIRFRLEPEDAARFRDPSVPARILVDHPSYRREAVIPEPLRRSLGATLAGEPPSLMPTGAAATSPAEAPQVLFETARVRALGIGPGVVVEPLAPTSLLAADSELLAEVMTALRRAAELVLQEHGRCRIWTEVEREAGAMRWHLRPAGS